MFKLRIAASSLSFSEAEGGKHTNGILWYVGSSLVGVQLVATRGSTTACTQTARQKVFVSWRMQPVLLLLLCVCGCVCVCDHSRSTFFPVLTANTGPCPPLTSLCVCDVPSVSGRSFFFFYIYIYIMPLGTKHTRAAYQTKTTWETFHSVGSVRRLNRPQSRPEPVCRSCLFPCGETLKVLAPDCVWHRRKKQPMYNQSALLWGRALLTHSQLNSIKNRYKCKNSFVQRKKEWSWCDI